MPELILLRGYIVFGIIKFALNYSNIKICHLTSAHPRSDTRIFYKFCKSFVSEGFNIFLVVADGKGDANLAGVRIIDAGIRSNNRLLRLTKTAWQVFLKSLKINAAVYFFHDPELIPIGVLMRLQGKRVLYDVHEDFPRQVLYNHKIPVWLRRFVSWAVEFLEKIAGLVFSGISTATPLIGSRFPVRKTAVIQNFPEKDELITHSATPYSKRSPTAVYMGNISDIRGAKEMVEAMALLPEKIKAKLILAGKFDSPSLEQEIRNFGGWERTDFVGWQDRGQVAELLGKSRIGMVVLHPTVNYLESYPLKLFEYMSTGIPVIASDFPLWRKIVGESGSVIFVNPLNPNEIAGGIEFLLTHPKEAEDMGKRGKKLIENKYNWEYQKEKLLRSYLSIIQDISR